MRERSSGETDERVADEVLKPFPMVRKLVPTLVRPGDKPLADHQALYSGFSNALGRAVEFAGAPIIFFLFGHWLDGRFGTAPIFAVVLFVLAVVGVSTSAYYRYKAEMEEAEKDKPWKRT